MPPPRCGRVQVRKAGSPKALITKTSPAACGALTRSRCGGNGIVCFTHASTPHATY